jgi:hypothetical protein
MAGSINRSRSDKPLCAASRRGPALAAMVLVALTFAYAVTARAGDMTRADPAVTGTPSILDGMVFSGEFGVLGKAALNTDTWVFEDGTFMSKQCEECGFPRGVYSTGRKGDKITFETETPCPRTDAKLVWRGTIENGRIEGVYTWTKTRWYRTIRKDFWFKGTLGQRKQTAVGP